MSRSTPAEAAGEHGPDPARAEELGPEPDRLRRGLEEVRALPLSDRQAAARRLGDAMRAAIEAIVSSSAPAEVLDDATGRTRALVELLNAHPAGRKFEGFAEAANVGRSVSFFDWSPLAGLANPLAPPTEMEVIDSVVVGRARFGSAYEGPPGCVHGGFIAAAFDDVLGMTQSLSGRVGMTGTLTVRYRRPTPLHTDLRLEGRLLSVEGRKVFTSCTMWAADRLTAEAEGTFISVGAERFETLARERPSP